MNTIETEVWKPSDKPGFITFDRCKTIAEWAKEVVTAFRALTPGNKWSIGDFEWFGIGAMEYCAVQGWTKASEIPRNARLAITCEQGGSEGYIVHVTLLPEDKPSICLLAGKCFDADYAWTAVRQLSHLLGIMPQPGAPIVSARCIVFPKEEPLTDAEKLHGATLAEAKGA